MKDKHGVEIEVGDSIYHDFYGNGKVRVVWEGSYFADWEECIECSNEECTCSSAVVVIEKAKEPKQQEVFTAEDQAMLDKLLKKKELFESESQKVDDRLQSVVRKMYKKAGEFDLGAYIRTNIDEIIDVLQTYKKYHG